MPSSVRRLTTLDHDKLDRLLRRVFAPGPSRRRWQLEFAGLLRAHRMAERDEVLPVIVSSVPALADAARAAAEADVEVDRLADHVAALDLGADPPPTDTVALSTHVEAMLAQHRQRWREQLMVPLEKAVARAELRRLGGAYESARDAELSRGGMSQAPPRRLDLSRAELYEMARRAGIDGRSAMTRQQLIEALQHVHV